MLGVTPRAPLHQEETAEEIPPLGGGSTREGQERVGREPRDDRDTCGVPCPAVVGSHRLKLHF